MGAQLNGEVAMELSGSPAEIGLDVASKMLRAVVVGAVEAGMRREDLGALLVGMVCGVCATFEAHLKIPDMVAAVRDAAELVQGSELPPKAGGFAMPEPGAVQ